VLPGLPGSGRAAPAPPWRGRATRGGRGVKGAVAAGDGRDSGHP